VNCTFPRDLLALHVSQDLTSHDSRIVSDHVHQCGQCQDFLDQLSSHRSELRSFRVDAADSSDFASVRHAVLAQIGNSNASWRWFMIERFLMLGFRRHAFAFASIAVAAVVSATLFAGMRQPASKGPESAAVFAAEETLLLPDNYRNWVLLGNSEATTPGSPHSTHTAKARNVYMDRRGYREFTATGKMPEGAVLVLELTNGPGQHPAALEASVKDSRFKGGWGFFDFTGADGGIQPQATAMPDNNTCRTCHEKRAPFDHVFTTVQEILKTAANHADNSSLPNFEKC